MLRFIPFILLLVALMPSCNSSKKKQDSQEETTEQKTAAYRTNIKNTVDLEIYDQYARKVHETKGTLLEGNIIAAPLNLVQGNYSVKCKFLGRSVEPISGGYYKYSFKKNLVLLNVTGSKQPFTAHLSTLKGDNFYSLVLEEGKIRVVTFETGNRVELDSVRFYPINRSVPVGTSVFNDQHKVVGMINEIPINGKDSTVLLPIEELLPLLPAAGAKKHGIGNLRLKSDKIYAQADKISGFKVRTTAGSFTFKVYPDLTVYKENMIKLVSDQFYDSLLIHRVIHNFLIQTGAADTKYAKKGDPIGWKGPGYMLPTIIKSKYIHKRSAVAMSKPPEYQNPDNLTSGSQFYIITGRTFNDQELKDYEELKGFTYTSEQRNMYNIIGGAAYLDNDYAVIGEVTSGMNIVDKIAGVPIGDDERPLADIRILEIDIVRQ